MTKSFSRLAAFIAAMLGAAVMLLAPSAFAQSSGDDTTLAPAPRVGQLTVHAERNTESGVKPIPGAVFQLKRVTDVDLLTNEYDESQWAKVRAYAANPASVDANLSPGSETLPATGTDGFSVIDIPVGLYQLTLTAPAPDGTTFESMLVTVPWPVDKANGPWELDYTVEVAPKPHTPTPTPSPSVTPTPIVTPAPPAPGGGIAAGLPVGSIPMITFAGIAAVAAGLLLAVRRRSNAHA